MQVTREHWLSAEAFVALNPAIARSNFDWLDVARIMRGHGWAVWNIGNVGWVFTMANTDNEIEVLLAGGRDAKTCLPLWEAAVVAEPAHKGMTVRIESRPGWRKLLPHWERRDDVLYLRIA